MDNFDSIRGALRYIDEHLGERVTYVTVANHVHFSPNYFNRIFIVITGQTVAAYIRDRRLEQARAMLSAADSILSICLDCGFNSAPAFTRAFKAKYGIAPSLYRAQKLTHRVHTLDEIIARIERRLERNNIMDKIKSIVDELTRKIERDPNDAEAYYERGMTYVILRRREDAIRDYTRAIELNPEKAYYYYRRGGSLMKLGDIEAAEADLLKAIELSPDSAELYGELYQTRKQFEDALAEYKRAAEREPGNALFQMKIGEIYFFTQRYADAKREYLCAAELEPLDSFLRADYTMGAGNAMQWMNCFEEAVEYQTMAIERAADNAYYYYCRGVSYQRLERWDDAVADFAKAIEFEPDNAQYYSCRGTSNSFLNKSDEALADYNMAIEMDPSRHDYYAERGCLYIKIGQYDDAVADLTRAIELDENPSEHTHYEYRGTAYNWKGECEAAIADFTRDIELHPDRCYSVGERACCYRIMGRYHEAIEGFTVAIEINPSFPAYRFMRSLTYDDIGERGKAFEDVNAVIEADSNQPRFYAQRGKLYIDMGRRDLAAADFISAVRLDTRCIVVRLGKDFIGDTFESYTLAAESLVPKANALLDELNRIDGVAIPSMHYTDSANTPDDTIEIELSGITVMRRSVVFSLGGADEATDVIIDTLRGLFAGEVASDSNAQKQGI